MQPVERGLRLPCTKKDGPHCLSEAARESQMNIENWIPQPVVDAIGDAAYELSPVTPGEPPHPMPSERPIAEVRLAWQYLENIILMAHVRSLIVIHQCIITRKL
eukprot:CAMPEP_0181440888 /NCGR_PEP_ID=MMETSP1110-20121109/23212_1 /TAXON_ID=174948 /ORGANISM="Symbiodinium sp., Strain CCMP421" /LENGTH=103 /DNA_ID=CAMNT_0023564731 /DNA_START=364 /DNA_END=675 /DNA_ORIENTATION=-